MSAAEMASAASEEAPALSDEKDVPTAATNNGNGEEKENGPTEPETEQPDGSLEPKMEAVEAEVGEEKPAADSDKAASEVVSDDGVSLGDKEVTNAPGEPEPVTESQQSPGDGHSEPTGDSTIKDAKEETGEDSRSSGTDSEKSKTVSEDGDKASAGGGEMGDKRRASVEISSSDGEPLSRMDSEDRLVCGITLVVGAVVVPTHPSSD